MTCKTFCPGTCTESWKWVVLSRMKTWTRITTSIRSGSPPNGATAQRISASMTFGFGASSDAPARSSSTRRSSPSLAHELLGRDGLTAHESSFTRRDVIEALCNRLPAGVAIDGSNARTARRPVLLADPRVVARRPPRPGRRRRDVRPPRRPVDADRAPGPPLQHGRVPRDRTAADRPRGRRHRRRRRRRPRRAPAARARRPTDDVGRADGDGPRAHERRRRGRRRPRTRRAPARPSRSRRRTRRGRAPASRSSAPPSPATPRSSSSPRRRFRRSASPS